jgi:hypothetical protein
VLNALRPSARLDSSEVSDRPWGWAEWAWLARSHERPLPPVAAGDRASGLLIWGATGDTLAPHRVGDLHPAAFSISWPYPAAFSISWPLATASPRRLLPSPVALVPQLSFCSTVLLAL